ncbi:MAG: hypothetical protein WC450_10070 [Candidatus Omnitrophota bacterium]|jgi:hypothetical protein
MTSTITEVKEELNALFNSRTELLSLAKNKKKPIEFGTKYQAWYSRAYKFVESLAPERLDEFTGYYLIDPKRKTTGASNYTIQDYIMGTGATIDYIDGPLWDVNAIVTIRIINQFQIIQSLSSRIDGIFQDITGHLYAELQDSELHAASQLIKTSIRAAGALAGVVLERHLQRVSRNHKIEIKKKDPTISDLNDPIKNGKVYDVPVWRKIQLLADIRNLCTHQKSKEPTREQVDELISGVSSVIKSVF